MRIAVDVDGVLAERIPAVLALVNERHGLSLTKADVTTWGATLPGTDATLREFFVETDRDPDHVRGLAPIEGAIDGMNALAGDHELLIATYRDPAAYEPTRRWLRDHDIPFDRFVEGPGEAKLDVDADLLVDDSARTVRRFARERGRAVLFSQPWNLGEPIPGNATAVRGWVEVLRHVGADPVD